MRRFLRAALSALLTLSIASLAHAADRPAHRVLFIGIDGCRSDAIETGKLPNLHALIKDGAVSYATSTRGDRANASDTISGPG
jgi:predicted AlkP superfamily pyrophosphatase or phosphodiesterase